MRTLSRLRQLLAATVAGTICALTGTHASAQFIDYQSLEDLFGEPVTTSATGQPQKASDAPANLIIITAEEIRRKGARTVPDALRNIVGISVQDYAADQQEVAIRGYRQANNPRLLVLLNGRQVYTDDFGRVIWSLIPVQIDEIRQIEVVKGPSGALFGFNAVNGVVNIITYSPLTEDRTVASFGFGTLQDREASGVVTAKISDRVGMRLSAGYRSQAEFDTDIRPSGQSEITTFPLGAGRPESEIRTDPVRRSLLMDVGAAVTDDIRLGVELSASGVDRTEFLPNANSIANGSYSAWSAKISGSADTRLGLLEGTVYRNRVTYDLDPANFSTPVSNQNTTTVARLQSLFRSGNNAFRITGEYRRNELTVSPEQTGTVSYDVYSLGGMWSGSITDSWSLTTAARVDRFQLDRVGTFVDGASLDNEDYRKGSTHFSGNIGLIGRLSDVDTLRFTVGRAIQLPSLIELSLQLVNPFGPVRSIFLGNPFLEPSTVTSVEAQYERKIAGIGGAASVALFATRTEDLTAFSVNPTQTGPTTFEVMFENIANSNAVGAEFAINGTHGDLRWSAGYALQFVTDDIRSGQPSQVNGLTLIDFEDSTPVHSLNFGVGYTWGPVELDAFAHFVSATEQNRSASTSGINPQRVDIPANLNLSGRIGYKINEGAELALIGQQINQDTLRTTGVPESERRVFLQFTIRP